MEKNSACEYCGDEHDVRELCGKRMSRRRFFSLSARAIVVAAIAPQIVDAAQALIQAPAIPAGEYGWVQVGGIDRASFSFWRNKQGSDPAKVAASMDALRESMTRIYTNAHAGRTTTWRVVHPASWKL